MKDDDYKFLFSVVIPIYNVENYLEETIESVINQTIGFKENIQLILVNDGSPDNSEKICLKYKEMYPNNVTYVKQENAGVSAARNKGINYIEGKYVNFLDSDDKWDKDVFEKAAKMFKEHKNIDVIGVRQQFFEASDEYPALDFKFNEDEVIDIFEDYDYIQLSVTSAFIRTSALKNKEYDTRVKYSEDAKLLYEIILEKEHYGIISSSLHLYRKRFENNSAIQGARKNKSWYLDTTKLCYKYVFDLSKKKYGYVIPFVQYYLAYDLQWRFIYTSDNILTKEEENEYISSIKELLKDVDDSIILMQKNLWRERKVYLLCLKYGKDIRKEFVYNKGKLYFKNQFIYEIKNQKFCSINIIDIKDNNLYLEGKIKDFYYKEDYEIYVKDNKKNKYYLEYYDIPTDDQIGFTGEHFFKGIGFRVSIPLKGLKSFRIMIDYQKIHTKRLYINFTTLSGMSNEIDNYYLVKNNYVISIDDNIVNIEKNKKGLVRHKEFKYLFELVKKIKFNIILYRIIYKILKKFKKKEIWLVTDRSNVANDNGMHFFKYVNSIKNNINSYFIIDRKSKDYSLVKKYGKVIKANSIKHKLLFLLSDKIISSQADEWIINAFGDNKKYIINLYNFKFVFLQHGITHNDLSEWLHKQNKNIKLLVTATTDEYNSFIEGNYGYTKDEVKLTGFPRFDNLTSNSKKQIVFMPTWRANLAGNNDIVTGLHEYNPGFKNSDYCKFYNNLINDERIIDILKKYGYTGKFFIHPSIGKQIIDFEGNDTIKLFNTTADYQKEFSENVLLITDYSSVAFDFSYLYKSIIYTQFDIDEFYENQVYDKGYYDYEKDGFGPICYDYEESVKTIINYINNGCKLENKYKERIDKFYKYHDKENSKRVYEEIKKLN